VNYLLDTHALLWWLEDDSTLSTDARDAISDAESNVYVSAVTAWEISIKSMLSKLKFRSSLEEELRINTFQSLPITVEHGLFAGRSPLHHSDPFDRMLIAQATLENLTLITRDKDILQYDVRALIA
jgi:PIN domain nuclease of toxin-antitoxin system